jgi:cysteinyl-tRNA synthetase
MDDDFNTPQALGALFELARLLYTARDQAAHGPFLLGVGDLVTLARVIGLLQAPGRERARVDQALKAWIESLVAQRGEARRRRDFQEADRLREELARLGVALEDTSQGTNWKLSS